VNIFMSSREKVVVGLSGGVDSSVTAALLVQQKYQVAGLTLWLLNGKGSCCSDGMKDAAKLCDQLNIPHYVVDVRQEFDKRIVQFIVDGYKHGVTPLPCSRCNKDLKFGLMLDYAREKLEIPKIATGHYARVDSMDGRYRLRRAVDRNKDQSYFLYELSQAQLRGAVFPLGETTKDQTRAMARALGLAVADKPESMDLCLVEAAGSMRNFLDEHLDSVAGEIVHTTGAVLGKHDGAHHFTIGQRKGLGIAAAHPLYVLDIQVENNRVIVGPREDAFETETSVQRVNWVSCTEPSQPIRAEVQIRYRSSPVLATIVPVENNQARIVFDEPQFGITPGQAAVWYDGDILLGGGLIRG
jgi:tRNA-uridine 2-sulfurtransferase